jgi:hypothetical protein
MHWRSDLFMLVWGLERDTLFRRSKMSAVLIEKDAK